MKLGQVEEQESDTADCSSGTNRNNGSSNDSSSSASSISTADSTVAPVFPSGVDSVGSNKVATSFDSATPKDDDITGGFSPSKGWIVDIHTHISNLVGKDTLERVRSAVVIRKMLCSADSTLTGLIVSAGAIPPLLSCLRAESPLELQLQVAWALTDLASSASDTTRVLVQENAVPSLLQLVTASSRADVQRQAVWALGNFAGDIAMIREYVRACGTTERLAQLVMAPETDPATVRVAVWALANLCRSPSPDREQLETVLAVFAQLACSDNVELLSQICRGINFIAEGSDDMKIEMVLRCGLFPGLIEFLHHESHTVRCLALKAVGNMMLASGVVAHEAMKRGVFSAIMSLQDDDQKEIRLRACWTLSMIFREAVGHDAVTHVVQLWSVQDAASKAVSAIPAVLNRIATDDVQIQKEATLAFRNICSYLSRERSESLRDLVVHSKPPPQQSAVAILCKQLDSCSDVARVRLSLQTLDFLLEVCSSEHVAGTSLNPCAELIDECGGLDALENLQMHNDQEIYELAARLLTQFFEDEEEQEDVEIAAETASSPFSFFASPSLPMAKKSVSMAAKDAEKATTAELHLAQSPNPIHQASAPQEPEGLLAASLEAAPLLLCSADDSNVQSVEPAVLCVAKERVRVLQGVMLEQAIACEREHREQVAAAVADALGKQATSLAESHEQKMREMRAEAETLRSRVGFLEGELSASRQRAAHMQAELDRVYEQLASIVASPP